MAQQTREAASIRIAGRVRQLLEDHLLLAETVALYAPKGTEVDTLAIDINIREARGRVAYPRVAGDVQVLAFHEAAPDQLVAGRFGLREPQPDEHTLVSIADIRAYIVPGLAFDRKGWRIGWGRGHYDATLTTAPSNAIRIGLGYECQIVDRIPHEAHDAQLHYVVTELATYKA